MCPSGICFDPRSRGENFCGGGRARRGRCGLICVAEDWWGVHGRSRHSILPFLVVGAGRKVWGVEILLAFVPWQGDTLICSLIFPGTTQASIALPMRQGKPAEEEPVRYPTR